MDEIEDKKNKSDLINSADSMYDIMEIMERLELTADQILFILCKYHNITYETTANDLTSIINKGLIKKDTVDAFLLFDINKAKQLTLDLNPSSKPIGTEVTLDLAHRIEKEIVRDKYLEDEGVKLYLSSYNNLKKFKGDIVLGRYFLIFQSLFPGPMTHNTKWNKRFGIIYDGNGLQDITVPVINKFIKIYKTKDIGIFLKTTYDFVKRSVKVEEGQCFMMKPNKFLSIYEPYYNEAIDKLSKIKKRSTKDMKNKINKLKV